MLDLETIKKIEDLVAEKPRSMQEIAFLIKKNWRTADRYVGYIKENFGTIDTRTFREGTRGALKIVHLSSFELKRDTVFQKSLQEQIESSRIKEDFSAFDIYQHVENKNKQVSMEKQIREEDTNLKELAQYLEKTKKNLLIFSGNLSWINLKNKDINIFNVLEKLTEKGVSIKIISRVDITSFNNIKKILDLNYKFGKNNIEIRHREQPLRSIIIDNKISRIKEIKEPTGKIHELNERIFIFYTIKDKIWNEWLSKIFLNMFRSSIDYKIRLKEIEKISDLVN